MDAYPKDYVKHNLPLVLLSGLGKREDDGDSESLLPRQESGTRIQGSSPECGGDRARLLFDQFLAMDGSNVWQNASSLPGPAGSMKFKFKTIGRSYTLPPRKAAPLPQSPSTEGPPSQPTRVELHSPLSPLSPGSPIFPDGLFTPLWIAKHQTHIPALMIAFFHISTTDSHTTDEKVKVDINAIRTALTRSGYKTRFATVLISDKSILQAPELEERLSSIKRLTSLDSKTGLFFMPPMNSAPEIATFVQSVMIQTLQPLVVEFYRDLTKHARRKKARGGPPVQSLTSPTAAAAGTAALSTVGWNARYEIKQGVFAEFRQEMDVAERHYSTSLDDLFSSEGVFETTPSWSPRWEEARLLADSLANRQLRCLLWNERTTAAAQCWLNYRSKMQDLIDRRGKGSGTYSWAAWESRWAQVMGELIQSARLLQAGPSGDKEGAEENRIAQIFATPERNAATTNERIPPWQNLHHPGYWFALANRGVGKRLKRVEEIPEEDRSLSTDGKSSNYDTYLAPQPHDEYANKDSLVTEWSRDLTEQAAQNFDHRGQNRMSETLKLDLARSLVEIGHFEDGLQFLIPLWDQSTWRRDGWHDMFAQVLLLLRACAEDCVGRRISKFGSSHTPQELIVAVTYELISIPATILSGSQNQKLDLMNCLENVPLSSTETDLEESETREVSLEFKGKQRLCPVSVSVAFESKETHVGEPIGCQLILESNLNEVAAPLSIFGVSLQFGDTKKVQINHDPDAQDAEDESIDLVNFPEISGRHTVAEANLWIRPGQRRMYNFSLTFREADSVSIKSATLMVLAERFSINHVLEDEDIIQSRAIFVKKNGVIERKPLPHFETATIRVLPKPPKVRILVHGLRKQYYVDELVRLTVEVVNGEADEVSGDVSARADDWLTHGWVAEDAKDLNGDDESSTSIGKRFEGLESSTADKAILCFRAPQDPARTVLGIDVDYRLSTDGTTPLQKSLTLDLQFINPFDVKFSFGPLLYSDQWPSYFDRSLGHDLKKPGGIPQLWRLSTQIRSLANENIILREVIPKVDNVIGDSVANLVNYEDSDREPFQPGDIERQSFEILTQKYSLDDRRPTTVESTLSITWSRDENSPSVVTTFPVPRLTLPVSEPRVLCTLAEVPSSESDNSSFWDASLHYHIENPSTHFLTFALTMEATEEFAFSGPKYRTLSLAPLSRHKVEYRLSLQDHVEDNGGAGVVSHSDFEEHGKGRWIWPSLQVIDSYYQKTLRVHPGGIGVKFDEKQNITVFIKEK